MTHTKVSPNAMFGEAVLAQIAFSHLNCVTPVVSLKRCFGKIEGDDLRHQITIAFGSELEIRKNDAIKPGC